MKADFTERNDELRLVFIWSFHAWRWVLWVSNPLINVKKKMQSLNHDFNSPFFWEEPSFTTFKTNYKSSIMHIVFI